MSVYTVLFWQGELPTANTALYTVPAGITGVLRDILFSTASSGLLLNLETQGVTGFGASSLLTSQALTANQVFHLELRAALPAGSQINGFASAAGVWGQLTGYNLS